MDEDKKTLTLRERFLGIAPSLIKKVERFKRMSKDKKTIEACIKTLKRLKELQKKEIFFEGEEGKKEVDLMIQVSRSVLGQLFAIDNVERYPSKGEDDGRKLLNNASRSVQQTFIIESYLSTILNGAYSCVVEDYAVFHKGICDYLRNEAFRDPDFGDFYMP